MPNPSQQDQTIASKGEDRQVPAPLVEIVNREVLSSGTFIGARTQSGKMAYFCDLASFNPKVESGNTAILPAREILDLMRGSQLEVALREATLSSAQEYPHQVFVQVEKFLQSDGAKILGQLGIADIRLLTPKEAVMLSCYVVAALSKYNSGYLANTDSTSLEDTNGRRTVSQFLDEGINNHDDANWKGNGVCRHIAVATLQVFNALKANQRPDNLLHGTYCHVEVGNNQTHGQRAVKLTRGSGLLSNKLPEGCDHAWNAFYTLDSAGNAARVETDITWVLSNRPAISAKTLDCQRDRAHALILKNGQYAAFGANLGSFLDYTEEQLRKLAKLQQEGQLDKAQTGEIAIGYAKRALAVASTLRVEEAVHTWMSNFPDKTNRAIQGCSLSGFSEEIGGTQKHIEILFAISHQGCSVNLEKHLASYAQTASLEPNRQRQLIFGDDELQEYMHKQLSVRPGYDQFLDKASEYRARIRATTKDLPPFSLDNPADRGEMISLIHSCSNHHGPRLSVHSSSRSDIERVSRKIREEVRKLLSPGRQEQLDKMSDYQMLADYKKLVDL